MTVTTAVREDVQTAAVTSLSPNMTDFTRDTSATPPPTARSAARRRRVVVGHGFGPGSDMPEPERERRTQGGVDG